MNSKFDLSGLFFTLLRKILFLWVRTEVKGISQEELNLDPNKPVCYVLQYSSLSARLVLEETCRRNQLPSSQAKIKLGQDEINRSFFFLYERQGHWFRRRHTPMVTDRLKQISYDVAEDPELDVQIVPVSLFWGRGPEKEKSLLKLLWRESWTVVGPFQKFLIILIHGRRTFVQFNQPLSFRQAYDDSKHDANISARKVARILRLHFRRVKQTVLGPNLSHRQTLVRSIIKRKRVRDAVIAHAEEHKISKEKALIQAHKYGDELAANLQISTVHLLERLLHRLWNKIYKGIKANNIEYVREVTKDHAVIYVPCHRSHIDYLLLSSLLFEEGIMVPHIAAGKNLNLPIVGSILRRGGAFFMRRSFKGNPLYSAVFSEYIHTIFKGGYSMEYFVEGGRSRTGRTLNPKAGMLAMTVNSFLRDSTKPIAFVPVYFGYEKILEGSSYQGELRGKEKKKESIFGLVKSLKSLRRSYGQVGVNFGKPIYLSEFLDSEYPDWREQEDLGEEKPSWFLETVDNLASEVVTRINASAALNPVNLLALVLLATSRQAMDSRRLAKQMTLFASMLKSVPYSEDMTFPEGDGSVWLEYVEEMGLVGRQKHELGDIIYADDRQAVSLTYNRNNILHLFAIPSLIAALLQQSPVISKARVFSVFCNIYPYIRSELFLTWRTRDVEPIFERWLEVLAENELITIEGGDLKRPPVGSVEFVRLSVLARFIIQTLERYYIAIALLTQRGSGVITAQQLEEECTQMAERMSILFGLNAPEFFDKTLFRNFINELKKYEVLSVKDDETLTFDEQLDKAYDDARLILNPELRQSIIQVTSLN